MLEFQVSRECCQLRHLLLLLYTHDVAVSITFVSRRRVDTVRVDSRAAFWGVAANSYVAGSQDESGEEKVVGLPKAGRCDLI